METTTVSAIYNPYSKIYFINLFINLPPIKFEVHAKWVGRYYSTGKSIIPPELGNLFSEPTQSAINAR
jgi:hypothetical protein